MSRRDDGGDLNFSQKVLGGLIGAVSNTHAHAISHRSAAEPGSPELAGLLAAVEELRADLPRLVQNSDTAALDEALGDTEAEIRATGRAAHEQLGRLAAALREAEAVTGFLASAAAVDQALRALRD